MHLIILSYYSDNLKNRLTLEYKNIKILKLKIDIWLICSDICDSAPYESIKLHYNFTNTKTLFTSLNIFTTKIDQVCILHPPFSKIIIGSTSLFIITSLLLLSILL